VTHQALGTPVDVRVVEACITHSWGIDQGGDFSEVLGTEFVKGVDVRILKLGQVLDKIARESVSISQLGTPRRVLTMYFSSGVSLDRSCARERR